MEMYLEASNCDKIFPIPVASFLPISISYTRLQVFVCPQSLSSMSCIFRTAMIMCSFLQDGQSSLMFASHNEHIEVVRMLLSAGAKVDLPNKVSITSTSQGLW